MPIPTPPPPEFLVDALQDRLGPASGPLRAAKAVKPEEPVMPIPTPEPPVKIPRYLVFSNAPLAIVPVSDGEWVKWSDVEALLLQRAQEIEHWRSYMEQRCADHPESEREWQCIACLEAQLAARAQEIEQVKAERDSWRAAERSVSDAYLRVRQLLGAFNTKPGGTDRFEVTEQAIRNLKVKADAAPLPASAALQALIKGWRERSASLPADQDYDRAEIEIEKCADELEAALSRADQP